MIPGILWSSLSQNQITRGGLSGTLSSRCYLGRIYRLSQWGLQTEGGGWIIAGKILGLAFVFVWEGKEKHVKRNGMRAHAKVKDQQMFRRQLKEYILNRHGTCRINYYKLCYKQGLNKVRL